MAGGFSSDPLLQRCTQSAGAGPFPFLRDELGGQRGQRAVEYTTVTVLEQQDADELSKSVGFQLLKDVEQFLWIQLCFTAAQRVL